MKSTMVEDSWSLCNYVSISNIEIIECSAIIVILYFLFKKNKNKAYIHKKKATN